MLWCTPVTGACTVAVFAHRRILMVTWAVVIRMTSRTIRLETGRRPGYNRCITAVAGNAWRINHVVARVVRRTVTECQWNPGCGRMAVIALQTGNKVAIWHTGRLGPIMAAGARSGHLAVVESCRNPGNGRMAVITLGIGLDMGRWLARGGDVIVTGAAGTG